MKTGWGYLALLLSFLAGSILFDRMLVMFVSPLALVSPDCGTFAVFDRHLSFVNDLRAREMALSRIQAERDPSERRKLMYQLLRTMQAAVDEEARSGDASRARADLRQYLEDMVAEHIGHPGVLDAALILFKGYQQEGRFAEATELLGQLTRLASHPDISHPDSLRVFQGAAAAVQEAELLPARHTLLRRAVLRHADDLALHEMLYVTCAKLGRTEEAEEVRARLQKLIAFQQGARSIQFHVARLAALAASVSPEFADGEAERVRASFGDPKLLLQFDAAYCAMLLERQRLAGAYPLLRGLLLAQDAALPGMDAGMSRKDGIRLILAGFEAAAARGDAEAMAAAARLCGAFAPAYLPWIEGERWVVEGMSPPPVKPVCIVPLVDDPGIRADGGDAEPAWAHAAALPGPYYHYPLVNNVKVFDTDGTLDPEIRLLRDADTLHLFISLPEPHIDRIRAVQGDLEDTLWRDDSVELFFFSDRSLRRYVQLLINAAGKSARFDITTHYYMNTHVEPGQPSDPMPLEGIAFATRVGTNAWTLECSIPFSVIGFGDGSCTRLDGFAFRRNRYTVSGNKGCEAWSLTHALDSTQYQQTQMFLQRGEEPFCLPVPAPLPEAPAAE